MITISKWFTMTANLSNLEMKQKSSEKYNPLLLPAK
jgi:hypothetical protein